MSVLVNLLILVSQTCNVLLVGILTKCCPVAVIDCGKIRSGTGCDGQSMLRRWVIGVVMGWVTARVVITQKKERLQQRLSEFSE